MIFSITLKQYNFKDKMQRQIPINNVHSGNQKQQIIQEFDISPRCVVSDILPSYQKRCEKKPFYSWKNLLNPEVSDKYSQYSQQYYTSNHPRYREYSENFEHSRNSRNFSRISEREDYGINTQNCYFSDPQIKTEVGTSPREFQFTDRDFDTMLQSNYEGDYPVTYTKSNKFDGQANFDKFNRSQETKQVLSERMHRFRHKNIGIQTKLSGNNPEADSYGLRLKLQERMYLMKKYMEHVEDTHGIKL